MIFFLLLLFCVIFIELFLGLNLLKDAKAIIDVSKESMKVLLSSNMLDEDKENIARESSLKLFKFTISFIAKIILISTILYLGYFSIGNFSPNMGNALLDSFLSFQVSLLLTFSAMSYVWIRNVILRKL